MSLATRSSSRRHEARQVRSPLPGVEIVSIRSDRSFPRHSHDVFGIGVVVAGGHRSWSGRGAVEAGPGDCIAVNPGEVHDGHPVADGWRAWRMLYLERDVFTSFCDEPPHRAFEIARPAFADPPLARRILDLHTLLSDPAQDPTAAEEALVGLGRHLVDRHAAAGGPRRCEPPPAIRRAKELIDDAPERPVTLARLAAATGLSRFQVLREFARAHGITPNAYMIQRRVGLARAALMRGETPAEAAAAAGFADQSHLTRAFGRQFGTTPARFRAAMAVRLQ